jgi:aspartyl-tRNA(Asn)/glutamyl-tRNA(Gln) amidotransferase subunit A
MRSLILKIHEQYANKQVNVTTIIKNSQRQNKQAAFLNSVITDNYEATIDQAKILDEHFPSENLLAGIPYTLKDNISTKDIRTTAGSKFLADYIPPYSATVYDLLNRQHALMVSKSNLDEFGLGGTGTFSSFGIVKNVLDPLKTTGGSSSGSANLVAANIVAFAIATDTGDSIRRPASFTGIVGFKPSYGSISRYGVIPYAPSLDTVGILARYVADIAIVADTVFAYDEKDYTSRKTDAKNFFKNLTPLKNIKFVAIRNLEKHMHQEVEALYLSALATINKEYPIEYVDVDDHILKALGPTYMVLANGEASSCMNNCQGLTFGPKTDPNQTYEEQLFAGRTYGFGNQLKRRLTIGAYVTNEQNHAEIFLHAKKVRTALINEIERILAHGDCLILPGSGSFAPSIADVVNERFSTTIADDTLLFANFAGCPSITLPYKKIGNT